MNAHHGRRRVAMAMSEFLPVENEDQWRCMQYDKKRQRAREPMNLTSEGLF